ncbi:hypothetical protein NicSoilE8_42990 (plasmid) [Arthrobacter sp. NicSoilE8]|nr:hypothetical protein NicSoilE8_42990 [Arthrobacter sp. NicSoilE8]
MEDLCEKDLNNQVQRVLAFIDPVFDGSAEGPSPVEPSAGPFRRRCRHWNPSGNVKNHGL